MTPKAAAQVLKAGGLVVAGTALGTDEAIDTVRARAYRHPVLPGRAVVRLTAEAVVAGDDLEMATLGFGAAEDRGAVGVERKRPLGFPGWALVHDPAVAAKVRTIVEALPWPSEKRVTERLLMGRLQRIFMKPWVFSI